jgi:hypothetical protein
VISCLNHNNAHIGRNPYTVQIARKKLLGSMIVKERAFTENRAILPVTWKASAYLCGVSYGDETVTSESKVSGLCAWV